MTDNLTPEQRSETMRRVKSRDTGPELLVRRLCRELGAVGYRLHRSDLPGKPDIAFLGKRKAIFVHGCFWHGHSCPAGVKVAKTNGEYWRAKIERNMNRDRTNLESLQGRGWKTLVLWECEMKQPKVARAMLEKFFRTDDSTK